MRPQVVTTTGVSTSQVIPLDWVQKPFNASLFVEAGANTVTIEVTPSDVLAGATPVWFPVTGLVSATGNVTGNLAFPVFAIRINQTVGAGTTTLTILQSSAQ